jgi:hypothetical protein
MNFPVSPQAARERKETFAFQRCAPGLFPCFPLHFRCNSAARSPAIPLPGRVGNFSPPARKINDFGEGSRLKIGC